MRQMRQADSSELLAIVLALLLLAPPLVTIAYRELGPDLLEVDEPGEVNRLTRERDEALVASHRLELAVARLRKRLDALERWQDRDPYVPRTARVLPLRDPSSRRHSLWVVSTAGEPLPADSVLVSGVALVGYIGPGGYGGAGGTVRGGGDVAGDRSAAAAPAPPPPAIEDLLVGGGFTFARATTVQDSRFRIRVRLPAAAPATDDRAPAARPAPASGRTAQGTPHTASDGGATTVWGFVSGTGNADALGRPLLELRLLSADVHLVPGTKVYTDGEDATYPGGVLVGEIAGASKLGANAEYHVRAAVRPDSLRQVVVLVDAIREAARAARRRAASASGERSGGRP